MDDDVYRLIEEVEAESTPIPRQRTMAAPLYEGNFNVRTLRQPRFRHELTEEEDEHFAFALEAHHKVFSEFMWDGCGDPECCGGPKYEPLTVNDWWNDKLGVEADLDILKTRDIVFEDGKWVYVDGDW